MKLCLLAAVVLAGMSFFLSSCARTKELVYLQGQFDTARLSQINAPEPVIRKGDLLSIIVFSDNPDATRIYNQSLITEQGSAGGLSAGAVSEANNNITGIRGNSPSAAGYEVDQNGDIVFQGLGLLHVEGLTKAQLEDTLNSRLRPFLKNPYYNIRFLNYKFTMLGELNKPGVISVPGQKVNLLEALAMAGDMTFYGRRDNILVIRENNNKREYARLDITKPEIVASPYFYLQQNDVVIVEPNKRKAPSNDVLTTRAITIATALISAFAILYTIFHNN
jgi:polysaccharide export outer membrane protein